MRWSVNNPPSPRTVGIAVRAFLCAATILGAAAVTVGALAAAEIATRKWPTGGARP